MRAAGFALALTLPSTAVVSKYVGASGTAAYLVAAFVALVFVHRHFDTCVRSLSRRQAATLLVGIIALLVVTFAVGYPLANSGVYGRGTDRDEHLNIGATELLSGRYPYYQVAPVYESFISQMPGALMLAIPFALLGNAAYQNLFWTVLGTAALGRLIKDQRPAVLLLLVILGTSPAVVTEFATGGDLLSNGIYVTFFMLWLVHGVSQLRAPRWITLAAAAALGIGLSSRAHFVLLTPLVWSALAQRVGTRAAAGHMGLVIAAFGLVTLPFYVYDPAAFSPLETAGFLQPEWMPPWFGLALAGVCAAVAVWLAIAARNGQVYVLLRSATVVLAVPILLSTVIRLLEGVSLEMSGIGYGVSLIVPAVVAFMPEGPSSHAART